MCLYFQVFKYFHHMCEEVKTCVWLILCSIRSSRLIHMNEACVQIFFLRMNNILLYV